MENGEGSRGLCKEDYKDQMDQIKFQFNQVDLAFKNILKSKVGWDEREERMPD